MEVFAHHTSYHILGSNAVIALAAAINLTLAVYLIARKHES